MSANPMISELHIHLPHLIGSSHLKHDLFEIECIRLTKCVVESLSAYRAAVKMFIYLDKAKPAVLSGFFCFGNQTGHSKNRYRLIMKYDRSNPAMLFDNWGNDNDPIGIRTNEYVDHGAAIVTDCDMRLGRILEIQKKSAELTDQLSRFVLAPLLDEVIDIQYDNIGRLLEAARRSDIQHVYVDHRSISLLHSKLGICGVTDSRFRTCEKFLGMGFSGHGGAGMAAMESSDVEYLFPPGFYNTCYSTSTEKVVVAKHIVGRAKRYFKSVYSHQGNKFRYAVKAAANARWAE